MPLERTVEIMEGLYRHRLSEGTIVEAFNQAEEKEGLVVEAIREELKASEEPAHFDDPGILVEKKLSTISAIANKKRWLLWMILRFRSTIQAERDLRMVKLKQKVSGCFRSEDGA